MTAHQNSTFVGHHTHPHLSKHPINCLQWLQDSIHLPTLRQAASESIVFMLLAVETVAPEEVDVSMAEVVAKEVEEEVDEV